MASKILSTQIKMVRRLMPDKKPITFFEKVPKVAGWTKLDSQLYGQHLNMLKMMENTSAGKRYQNEIDIKERIPRNRISRAPWTYLEASKSNSSSSTTSKSVQKKYS